MVTTRTRRYYINNLGSFKVTFTVIAMQVPHTYAYIHICAVRSFVGSCPDGILCIALGHGEYSGADAGSRASLTLK